MADRRHHRRGDRRAAVEARAVVLAAQVPAQAGPPAEGAGGDPAQAPSAQVRASQGASRRPGRAGRLAVGWRRRRRGRVVAHGASPPAAAGAPAWALTSRRLARRGPHGGPVAPIGGARYAGGIAGVGLGAGVTVDGRLAAGGPADECIGTGGMRPGADGPTAARLAGGAAGERLVLAVIVRVAGLRVASPLHQGRGEALAALEAGGLAEQLELVDEVASPRGNFGAHALIACLCLVHALPQLLEVGHHADELVVKPRAAVGNVLGVL